MILLAHVLQTEDELRKSRDSSLFPVPSESGCLTKDSNRREKTAGHSLERSLEANRLPNVPASQWQCKPQAAIARTMHAQVHVDMQKL